MIIKGYIRLSRDILNWQWYTDTSAFSLYIHLLLTANYDDEQWCNMQLHRGQRAVSMEKLAQETGLSKSSVVRTVKKLDDYGEITRTTVKNTTIFTVVNYEHFVLDLEHNNPSSYSQRTDIGPSSYSQRTDIGPESVQNRSTVTPNERNNKNKNNKYNTPARKNFLTDNNPNSFTVEMLEQQAINRYKRKSPDESGE